jgi:uncharacterized protein (TIGR02246 family)
VRRLSVLALLLATGVAQAADVRLTEPTVRAFVAHQEAAWNSKDARAFAATFTPDAVFIAQARDSHGGVTPNGRSTLQQATAQARRFFAKTHFQATVTVDQIAVSPDGRSAQVLGREVTRIEMPGGPPHMFCAETRQTLVLLRARILSQGQTDTDVRCPH